MFVGLGPSDVTVSYASNLRRTVKKASLNFLDVDLMRAMDARGGIEFACGIFKVVRLSGKRVKYFVTFSVFLTLRKSFGVGPLILIVRTFYPVSR